MPYIITKSLLLSLVLILSALLLLSAHPSLAADSTNGCYYPSTVKLGPRTCDPQGKNCNVPVVVTADHEPGMSLCFQGADTTYEVYPVSAITKLLSIDNERNCRPLVPSKAHASMADTCLTDVEESAKDAITNSGLKQQGTYSLCTEEDLKICPTGPAKEEKEQNCPYGLHTWMATCKTAECSNGLKVASYYCPEIKIYTIRSLSYGSFEYNFEVKKTSVTNTAAEVVRKLTPTSVIGDQPKPYNGWTRIEEIILLSPSKYTARQQPVTDGDCNDYCAMVKSGGDFHTTRKCYTTSGDLCSPTRQVTWQEFDPSKNSGSVTLPYTAEDGSVLDRKTYITSNIVNPFTYTANIDVDASPVDPEITSTCGVTTTATDVGVQTQKYPRPDLLYVRRVCDQSVLSFGECVLRYSHRDDTAMYWTVENRGSSSDCNIHVVDQTAAFGTVLSVTPMSERERGSVKKLPAWVIAVIVIAVVIVIAIIVIAALCMCSCTRSAVRGFFNCQSGDDKNTADTKHTTLNPLQRNLLLNTENKVDDVEPPSHSLSILTPLAANPVTAFPTTGKKRSPQGQQVVFTLSNIHQSKRSTPQRRRSLPDHSDAREEGLDAAMQREPSPPLGKWMLKTFPVLSERRRVRKPPKSGAPISDPDRRHNLGPSFSCWNLHGHNDRTPKMPLPKHSDAGQKGQEVAEPASSPIGSTPASAQAFQSESSCLSRLPSTNAGEQQHSSQAPLPVAESLQIPGSRSPSLSEQQPGPPPTTTTRSDEAGIDEAPIWEHSLNGSRSSLWVDRFGYFMPANCVPVADHAPVPEGAVPEESLSAAELENEAAPLNVVDTAETQPPSTPIQQQATNTP